MFLAFRQHVKGCELMRIMYSAASWLVGFLACRHAETSILAGKFCTHDNPCVENVLSGTRQLEHYPACLVHFFQLGTPFRLLRCVQCYADIRQCPWMQLDEHELFTVRFEFVSRLKLFI